MKILSLLKVLWKEGYQFIFYLIELANNATNLVLGGFMQFVWIGIGLGFQINDDHYFIGVGALIFISFIISMYRKDKQHKSELSSLKNRLPKYTFSYEAVRIIGNYTSPILEKLTHENKKPLHSNSSYISVGNAISNSSYGAGIQSMIESMTLIQPTEDETLKFKEKVEELNRMLSDGLYAIYLRCENVGNKADERVDINVYSVGVIATFISKPELPNEEDIQPKSRAMNSILNTSYLINSHPTMNIQVDGEVVIRSQEKINFWIKDTFQPGKVYMLPNDPVPLFIVSNSRIINLEYEVISKELPAKQTGTIRIDLAASNKVNLECLDDPFNLESKSRI